MRHRARCAPTVSLIRATKTNKSNYLTTNTIATKPKNRTPLTTSTDLLRLRQCHNIIQKIVTAVTLTVVTCFPSACGANIPSSPIAPDSPTNTGPWATELTRFSVQDQSNWFAKGGVVFVGSSSIRFWDLNAWFPGKTYLNRGFGGSQISDSIANIDLLVVKHQPRIVVFYAGDNDIAAGKTAEGVASDFVTLAKRVHATLTQTKILFIAIKPSIARWNLYERMAEANKLISTACNADVRLGYIDVATPMLGSAGRPNPDFFVSDGLHLSASGYGLWTQLVKPYLD